MRTPTEIEIEIAAARLTAGYHAADDTDDDIRDPYARTAVDFMLNCDRVAGGTYAIVELAIPDDAGWLGDLVRLYLEIVDDPGG